MKDGRHIAIGLNAAKWLGAVMVTMFVIGISLTAIAAVGMPQPNGTLAFGVRPGEAVALLRTPRDPRAPKIDHVYGSRTLFVGQDENFRVRLKPGAYWPIQYDWTLGNGFQTSGNNVVHHYDAAGNYRIDIKVANAYGSDSTSVWISVLSLVKPTSVAASEADRQSAETDARPSSQTQTKKPASTPTPPAADMYFSWALGTHLNRRAAENAVREYANVFPEHLRVYEDVQGSGTPAYRVLVGKYASEGSALRVKSDIEKKAGRPVSLFAIWP